MRIPTNRESDVPLYRQIQHYLQEQIISGALPADTRLPASRELAGSLGVSRLTVTSAYDELEALGLIFSVTGDGTYVADVPHQQIGPGKTSAGAQPPAWQANLPQAWRCASLELDERIAQWMHPQAISFAEGSGDSQLFPMNDFRKALMKVFQQFGKDALGYGDTAGYAPLRRKIARILANQGIPAAPEQVLITSGSQQGLELVFHLLVKPGDRVIAENPTHMGFLDLCRSMGVQVTAVPLDEQGMQVEVVERTLQEQPARLIYTVPNFQNPTGACLCSTRRRQLVSLAGRYGVPIVEDDFVGDLRYKGAAQPALKALDPDGSVIYVSTFSKMLIPSLRVGYVVSDENVHKHLLNLKHTSDIGVSNLVQHALDEYLSVGRYQACLRQARRVYGKRRDAMLAALDRHMPPGVRWTTPAGGLFIWLTLPTGKSADDFLPFASRAGVIFAPGSYFTHNLENNPNLRLNFARQPVERIEEGIFRLGKALREYIR